MRRLGCKLVEGEVWWLASLPFFVMEILFLGVPILPQAMLSFLQLP